MPREPWRDDPEYVSLWRAARISGDADARLVLADWLEEQGHTVAAWHERLHGITGRPPFIDEDAGTIYVGTLKNAAWRRLLDAPPPDDLLLVFDADAHASRWLMGYQGRCGLRFGDFSLHTREERELASSVPRLEALACNWLGNVRWDWVIANCPGLTLFHVNIHNLTHDRAADVARLLSLRSLSLNCHGLEGSMIYRVLPPLRHLDIGRGALNASDLHTLPETIETIHGLLPLRGLPAWPALRSFRAEPVPAATLPSADLDDLASHVLLERLDIPAWHYPRHLRALSELPRLRDLHLRFGDTNAPLLHDLTSASLERLEIQGRLDDRHLRDLALLPGLRSLTLDVRLGAEGIDSLARMSGLEELTFHRADCIAPDRLPRLAELPRLERLDLQGASISPEVARAVRAACPPWVECRLPE